MTTTIRRWRWAVTAAVAGAVALATLGWSIAEAQAPPANNKAAAAARPVRKGRPVAPHLKKAPPAAGDPLAKKAAADDPKKVAVAGTYHFRLKITAFDEVPLGTSYYPASKQDTSTPVLLLVHEKDRSDKDFEDPISELKNMGLAEYFQSIGYAVVSFDLRGHGSNRRLVLADRDWRGMVDDLQAVYQFLVDRHNRGELNIAKLGVVALGEGANLVSAWAYQPGGAVSSEGRVTDLSALALVSPLANGEGYPLTTVMNSLAPRIPVLLMVGERDALSHDAVKRVRPNVERTRQNKVEVFPSSLHAYKLLRLEPRVTSVLEKFLETTVKLRATDWEPRYNLSPVAYSDIQVIRHAKKDDATRKNDAAKEKDDAARKDDAAKEKDDAAKDDAAKEKPKGRTKGRARSQPQ